MDILEILVRCTITANKGSSGCRFKASLESWRSWRGFKPMKTSAASPLTEILANMMSGSLESSRRTGRLEACHLIGKKYVTTSTTKRTPQLENWKLPQLDAKMCKNASLVKSSQKDTHSSMESCRRATTRNASVVKCRDARICKINTKKSKS